MPVNIQTIINFVKKLVFKLLKTALIIIGVTIFVIFLGISLDYAEGYLVGFYVDWQGITLTHEERYFIHLLSDYVRFYGGVLLIIFLLLFPRVRKKILFF